MPQGKRRTPFSGKAKKEQLKAKKQGKPVAHSNRPNFLLKHPEEDGESSSNIQKLNYQPQKSGRAMPNRYALQFFQQTKEEIAQKKELAYHTLVPVSEQSLEIDVEKYFVSELDFPKRPPWSFEMDKSTLELKEQTYFQEYVSNIEKKFDLKELGFFELNLETWRQLWRVLEMSDIVLFIADIRYCGLMFPPQLYEYVTKTLKKDFILVLNKIDLAPAPLVVAWKNYFEEKYPELYVILFTTCPAYNLFGKQSDKAGLQVRRRKGKLRMSVEGALQIYEVCKTIVGSDVDLTSWEQKINEEFNVITDDSETKLEIEASHELKTVDTAFYEHNKFQNGVLTVGCIGQPNVGKSSLMNALKGKKVVSVSKTPGHTKHFQTIFLTPNVRLCDCPGLVFPSKVDKVLQVLMGSFPIAQLREPFTTVKYLAERLHLPKLLRITHPENDDSWSAMDICDGWAKKRGYLTAKAARLDSYRSANSLLRMALDGKICLCLRPPGYADKKDFWASHPEVQKVKIIQAQEDLENEKKYEPIEFSSSDDEEIFASGETKNLKNKELSSNSEDEDCSSEEEEEKVALNKFSVLQDE